MGPTKQQLISDFIAMTDKFINQGKQLKPNYLDILTDRVFHWFPHDGVPVAIELKDKLSAKYPQLFN